MPGIPATFTSVPSQNSWMRSSAEGQAMATCNRPYAILRISLANSKEPREQAITCEYHVWPMIWRFGELIVVRPLHWLEGWPLLEAPRCFVGSVASLELSNASHLRLREPRAAPQCPWQPNQSLQQVSCSEEIPSHLACCFESSKGYSYIEGHQGTSRDTKGYLILGYLRDTKEKLRHLLGVIK